MQFLFRKLESSTRKPSLRSPGSTQIGPPLASQPHNLFIFLEIFSCEGGIQSYVKDVLRSYLTLDNVPRADVYLLRDHADCLNPFDHSTLTFHYCKTSNPMLGRLQLAIALFKHLRRSRPQRVFCGHVNLAPLVAVLCHLFDLPYTVLTYGKEIWPRLPWPMRHALRRANQIWTISRYTRDRACQANSLNTKQFQLLPCVVDGDRFTPGPKPLDLLNRYGLSDEPVLMTVARLWPGDIYKGVDVTIRALPQIIQIFPTVKYVVIGRGNDQPRLATLAAELDVIDHVIFAGFVPLEALIDYYRLADVYVMPSQEGFGIVYLEAMACGVPVISGDSDGSADPLQDGRLGWRVGYRDPASVAQACIDILTLKASQSDSDELKDCRCDGAWLRQQALSNFGFEALAQQLAALLHHAI